MQLREGFKVLKWVVDVMLVGYIYVSLATKTGYFDCLTTTVEYCRITGNKNDCLNCLGLW